MKTIKKQRDCSYRRGNVKYMVNKYENSSILCTIEMKKKNLYYNLDGEIYRNEKCAQNALDRWIEKNFEVV